MVMYQINRDTRCPEGTKYRFFLSLDLRSLFSFTLSDALTIASSFPLLLKAGC